MLILCVLCSSVPFYLIIADGYVIGHYASNARDFLYPAVPPYPGSGREVTLFKTSLFNPIRITVSVHSYTNTPFRSLYILKSMKRKLRNLYFLRQ